MVPPELAVAQRHAASVATTITRGSSGDSSAIGSADFQWALEQAIGKAQTFRSVVRGNGADCQLTVHFEKLTQPEMGANLTVRITARWQLQRNGGGQALADEVVESSHTAKWGEAFVFATRLRLATEGAARENIQEGLARLAKLAPIAGSSPLP